MLKDSAWIADKAEGSVVFVTAASFLSLVQ